MNVSGNFTAPTSVVSSRLPYLSPALACSAVAVVSRALRAQTVQSSLPFPSDTCIALLSRTDRTASPSSWGGAASSTFTLNFVSAAAATAATKRQAATARVRVIGGILLGGWWVVGGAWRVASGLVPPPATHHPPSV